MKLGLRAGHYLQQFDELEPSLTSPTDTGNTGLSWLYLLFLLLLFLLSSLQVAKRSQCFRQEHSCPVVQTPGTGK